MSRRLQRSAWAALKKELKYLTTQTELLSACASSLASARQSQLYASVSTKFIVLDLTEASIFTHESNSQDILKRMNSTVVNIEKMAGEMKEASLKDECFLDIIETSLERISKLLQEHLQSCKETVNVLVTSPILPENVAKSMLALLIHRPVMHALEIGPVADIESLLKID